MVTRNALNFQVASHRCKPDEVYIQLLPENFLMILAVHLKMPTLDPTFFPGMQTHCYASQNPAHGPAYNLHHGLLHISHADAPERADELYTKINKELKPAEILISEIGCTIGTHTGPGTLAMFYEGDLK